MSIKLYNDLLDEVETRYRRERHDVCKERDAWIGTMWPMYKSGKFIIMEQEWCQWKCGKSPIGICVYQEDDMDHCVFCDLPEERK